MIAMDNKSKWIEEVEKEREYFSRPPVPFENWEQNSKSEWKAELSFADGLEACYANISSPIAKILFRACVEIVDRAFAEDRFHAKYAEYGLPRNIGAALRVRAYAKALLGELLVNEDLRQASANYIEWCSSWTGVDWDSQAQSDYLSAVRMSLIAGDIKQAQQLLATKRKFKWHTEEHGLLLDITREVQFGIPIQNLEMHNRVVAFFDRIRDPDFKPDVFFPKDMGRFEWGVLIEKYFTLGIEIDWQRVIDGISR